MMQRAISTLAALSALMAVAAGAFGAHGLEAKGDQSAGELFETASSYQMWHALGALVLIALRRSAWLAPLLLLFGSAVFSLSLYAIALGAPRALGIVTPLGGTIMLAGWLAAALALWRVNPNERPVSAGR